MFLLIFSDQEHWQCVCYRYIQQKSLLTLVSGKHGNSSICESGRLQPLFNQAYQFHADFHHHISIVWLSVPNLLFWTAKPGKFWEQMCFPVDKAALVGTTHTYLRLMVTCTETCFPDHGGSTISNILDALRGSHEEVSLICHKEGLGIWHLFSGEPLNWLSSLD